MRIPRPSRSAWLLVPIASLPACAALLGLDAPFAEGADASTAADATDDGGDAGPFCTANCRDIVDIQGGGAFACALYRDGSLYCWGDNSQGQIAQGMGVPVSTTPAPVSRDVKGALLPPFKAMTLGAAFGCAVGADNSVYCWGNSDTGQTGTGKFRASGSPPHVIVYLPTRVELDAGPLSAIGAGYDHVCVAAEASVSCWGDDRFHQLGFPPDALPQCTIDPSSPTTPCAPSPSAVISAPHFVQLAGAVGATCGVDDQEHVSCWGSDVDGELGRSLGTQQLTDPAPAPLESSKLFRKVAMGAFYGCGLTTVGELLCWGDNRQHSLGTDDGDGGDLTRARPAQPNPNPGKGFDPSARVDDVATDLWTTCALQDGKVFCWGQNARGEANPAIDGGPCTSDDFFPAEAGCVADPTPVAVDPGNGTIRRVITKYGISCALAVSDAGFPPHTVCWGASGKAAGFGVLLPR